MNDLFADGYVLRLFLVDIDDKILATFGSSMQSGNGEKTQKMNGVLKDVKVGFAHIPCLLLKSTTTQRVEILSKLFLFKPK